jgi:hypothetical protein
MEEAPENGKESSHSAHAKGMNENEFSKCCFLFLLEFSICIVYFHFMHLIVLAVCPRMFLRAAGLYFDISFGGPLSDLACCTLFFLY